MPFKASPRALGVLWALIQDSSLTSAEKLSKVLPECEKTLRKDLSELESLGLIKRGRYQIDRKVRSYLEVTEEGVRYLLGKFYPVNLTGQLQWKEQYKQNNHIPSTDALLKDSPDGEKKMIKIGVDTVPYDFFGPTSSKDDFSAEQSKWRDQKKAERQKAKAAFAAKNAVDRNTRSRSQWSCRDVAFEFSDRVEQFWSIPPWQVVKSRFIPALSDMRATHDTNGEIECIMLDLFFEPLKVERFENADHMWRTFISQAPRLAQQARAMLSSETDLVEAEVQSDRSFEWMDEE